MVKYWGVNYYCDRHDHAFLCFVQFVCLFFWEMLKTCDFGLEKQLGVITRALWDITVVAWKDGSAESYMHCGGSGQEFQKGTVLIPELFL